MDPTRRRPRRSPRPGPTGTRTRHPVGLAGVAAAALLAATLVVGCSGSGSDQGSGGAPALGRAPGTAGRDTAGGASEGSADAPAERSAGAEGGSVAETVAQQARSIIATGTVSLRADDVEDARFEVQRVVDEHDGEIADEKTDTDRDGEVRRSRLVLRVPVATFDDVLAEVSEVAALTSSTRSADDVTTQVIDTEVRVRAQRKSLERIEALLARAEDLQDIVAIESQLTSRQAELDSLEQQQAYLADQTSMATVTVLLRRTEEPVEREVDRAGFLAGLGDGWDALQRSTVALLTLAGALLPFVLLLGLLALPGRLLLRRLAARGTARRPARTP